MLQTIPVFIASPGDVPQEREMVRQATMGLSSKLRHVYGVGLEPVWWDGFAPIAAESPEVRPQDLINRELEACGIFVGVLYRRYGTVIDEGRNISGTEAEFQLAIKHRHRIRILTYFRKHDRSSVHGDPDTVQQLHRLDELRQKLETHGILYQEYCGPEEFERRITLDLLQAALEMITQATRCKHLRTFFRMGLHPRRSEPSVLIGYPGAQAPPGGRPWQYDWQERLLSHVVYEDFKAIQKVEAALGYIGVSDYSSVTLDHPELTSAGNRIWLCLPRNPLAQAKLRELGTRARFSFGPASGERYLWWVPRGSRKSIKVCSPLGKYLSLQRPRGKKVWDPRYGRIFCRDFAVLSRFAISKTRSADKLPAQDESPYYHYFFAGIRGLGTWGTGWYLDRRPDELSRLVHEQGQGDIQALLEVTFRDYRVVRVRDVSDEKPAYFAQQVDETYVREMIGGTLVAADGTAPSRRPLIPPICAHIRSAD